MFDSGKIIVGLIIGIILLTFPFWWNLGSAAPPAPDPKISDVARAAGECVRSKDYMTRYHMQLLDTWRNDVVRDRQRIYVSASGKRYDMSLQNTCMQCHDSKKDFCDQCHNYMAISPVCWDCHVAPEEKN